MDAFDRRLEIELKQLLDPIVDAPVARRRSLATVRVLPGGLLEQTAELAFVREPVAVPAPVGTPL